MNQNLIDIVKHAYRTVPFYHELYKDIDVENINDIKAFEKLPIVSKDMIQNHSDSLLSDQFTHYPLNTELYARRTSGSTGQYLKIYWYNKDNIHSLMELWYYRQNYYGISPNDKYCYFYTTDYQSNKIVEEKEYTVSLSKRSLGVSKNSLNNDKLIEICYKIYEFDPVWLMLQPSMAVLLADCIKDNNLPKLRSLRYIELTGEYLFESTRIKLTDTFGCKICNQYGCNEANSIASEFDDNQLHCHSSNVYVEIIKNGQVVPYGVEGDIYITSLTNYAMPFIRYKIGDRGRLRCDESKSKILELTMGRCNDFIVDDGDVKLPSYIFMRPIEHINEKIGNIINQYQIIQNDVNDFTVKLAIKQAYLGWKDTICNLFLSNLKQPSLKNAKWNFEISNQLFPEEKTGKLAYFYNRIGENSNG